MRVQRKISQRKQDNIKIEYMFTHIHTHIPTHEVLYIISGTRYGLETHPWISLGPGSHQDTSMRELDWTCE